MNSIPMEILKKYGIIDTLEERVSNSIHMTEREVVEEYYRGFLIATDHIPNKVVEAQILGAETDDYTEILNYRQFARDEINRLSK